MSEPVPFNPFEGRTDLLLNEEWQQEVLAAAKKSWKVDSAWYIGDVAIMWVNQHEKSLAEFYEEFARDQDPTEEVVTFEQLQTICEVCLAFPPLTRDLEQSFFEHYAGWVKQNHPNRASRVLDEMRQSGEYDG